VDKDPSFSQRKEETTFRVQGEGRLQDGAFRLAISGAEVGEKPRRSYPDGSVNVIRGARGLKRKEYDHSWEQDVVRRGLKTVWDFIVKGKEGGLPSELHFVGGERVDFVRKN